MVEEQKLEINTVGTKVNEAVIEISKNNAAQVGALSEEHREEFYEDEENTYYGNLYVDLHGTVTKEDEATNWLRKLFLGKRKFDEEQITYADYLKRIYEVFCELDFKNVTYMDVNGETVYHDEENHPDDFEKAVKAALELEHTSHFDVAFALDTTNDGEENVVVTFSAKHDVDEYPLSIEIMNVKKVNKMLEKIEQKIREKFQVEETESESDEEDEE